MEFDNDIYDDMVGSGYLDNDFDKERKRPDDPEEDLDDDEAEDEDVLVMRINTKFVCALIITSVISFLLWYGIIKATLQIWRLF